MNDLLQPVSRIEGPFWTWVVPVAVFLVALGATVLLYRHFAAGSGDEG